MSVIIWDYFDVKVLSAGILNCSGDSKDGNDSYLPPSSPFLKAKNREK